jgi:alpha-D-ribose 1-methylphosphonate 5-triphosphate synthase subunit PhnI
MGPAQDPEFVLYHADNVEASGFVQHLKLPHYVDFQSELDMVRRLRRAHGERHGGRQDADDQDADDQDRDAAE